MKVLFITNIPSPYRVAFFNELGKLCELTVLFERKSALNRDNNWFENKAINFKEVFLKGKNIGKDIAFCPSVIKYLNKKLFDLIIIGGYSTPTGMLAIQYLKIKRIPFILNSDGGMIKEDGYIKNKLKNYFISSASAWLCPSAHVSKYLTHYGANNNNIFIYPFTSIYKKDLLGSVIGDDKKILIKSSLGIKEEKVVISVGQFIYRKGFDVLLKASKAFDDNVGIYIIGGLPTNEYLNLIKSLNLKNIYFINFKTKKELWKYYLVSDVFVLPTREDIWGLVINEAMANGLPIVTTDKCVAGLELVENYENGFVVPTEDANSLSLRINEVIESDSLRKKMSMLNLEKIESYTVENMAKVHYEIFCKVLKL